MASDKEPPGINGLRPRALGWGGLDSDPRDGKCVPGPWRSPPPPPAGTLSCHQTGQGPAASKPLPPNSRWRLSRQRLLNFSSRGRAGHAVPMAPGLSGYSPGYPQTPVALRNTNPPRAASYSALSGTEPPRGPQPSAPPTQI